MTRNDLERLTAITDVKSDATLAALRQVRARQSELAVKLENLDAARRAADAAVELSDCAGLASAQAHGRWCIWYGAERGRLNIALAAITVEVEEARWVAARDVGRKDVVSRLSKSSLAGRANK